MEKKLKNMNAYNSYFNKEITKEVLDSIEVGDFIKINNWGRPLTVKAVSENYFIASMPCFERTLYTICDKRENFKDDYQDLFVCSADNFNSWGGRYEYSKESECEIALVDLEIGSLELSRRAEDTIRRIDIKKMKPKGNKEVILNELMAKIEEEEGVLKVCEEKVSNASEWARERVEIVKIALENFKNKMS